MKKRKSLLPGWVLSGWLLLALLCAPGTLTTQAEEKLQDGQVLANLNFDDGTTQGFAIYTNGGRCEISNQDGMLAVDIYQCGQLDYANQVYWDGFALNQDCVYRYSFDISGDLERTIEYRIQKNGGDYHAYEGEKIDIGPEMETISVDWRMTEESDPAPRIVFNMGKADGMTEDPGEHRILIDNIRLTVLDASAALDLESVPQPPLITLNQVGYRPEDPKSFVINDDSEEGTFSVINQNSGKVVFEGTYEKPVYNASTDTRVKMGDFSAFREEGTYVIQAVSQGQEIRSYPFEVAQDVYHPLWNGLVRMLYLQRCGIETDSERSGSFAHGPCHEQKALVYGTDETLNVSGGWHDAGDYGRYVVSGAKAVADLLMAYEEYHILGDDFGIPESGNGIPDLLDEARYELDWMLKMQNSETGGVYHKVTCYAFPGEIPPEDEDQQLVLAPVSTAATGDFAALMAKASVIWKKYDPDFSKKALSAAYHAWEYIKNLEDRTGFVNPPEISTGEYPDRGTNDEIFWAAAELLLTGDASFREEINTRYSGYLKPGLGWDRMNSYAFYDLLRAAPDGIEEVLAGCKKQLVDKADELIKKSRKDVYGMSLEKSYPWGSNMTVANNGLTLLMAARLTGNSSYSELAARQLNYLLGCNGLGYCFVSGFGTVSPVNPHHRPSQVSGSPMPGMLAGGPNSNLEDPYARGVLSGKAPALCYVDNEQSYSTNETAIYWNSALIWLLSAFL